ncbi:MAG: hypothetical protein MJ124_01075 [Lachnospiraceae bacterium]|nr:hypothetical protein [Lachnospiraceae bacterium]
MPEKIEEIMKKIHIYLANCKESAYSGEDVIVSKKRLLSLLDELNHAVFDVCEQYEATKEAKARALSAAERQASDIKQDAMDRAQDIYAASLVYMDDAILSMRNSLEYSYLKVRQEYSELISNYEEKLARLEKDESELTTMLSGMSESQMYLRIIEELKEKKKSDAERKMDERREEIKSTFVGEVTAIEALSETDDMPESSPADSSVNIEVHSAPKMADVSTKGKRKIEGFLKKFQKTTGESSEEIVPNEDAIDEDY